MTFPRCFYVMAVLTASSTSLAAEPSRLPEGVPPVTGAAVARAVQGDGSHWTIACTWSLYYRLRHDNAATRRDSNDGRSVSKTPHRASRSRGRGAITGELVRRNKVGRPLPTEEAVATGGATYRLCLATREIDWPKGGFPPASELVLPPGRHQIELKMVDKRDRIASSSPYSMISP